MDEFVESMPYGEVWQGIDGSYLVKLKESLPVGAEVVDSKTKRFTINFGVQVAEVVDSKTKRFTINFGVQVSIDKMDGRAIYLYDLELEEDNW